jgi:8-oxo-dGTP pyrophosphatase MutT (NUDIX family)
MPHIHDKIDFTVEVFIVYKNKVLLRMHDKHKIWLSVGGHIELDEDPVQAAEREVREEVGLDVEIVGETLKFDDDNYTYLKTPKFLGKHNVNDNHTHVVLVYFAKAKNDNVLDSHYDHEKTEIVWVSREDLANMDLRPNVKHLAEEALKELEEK